VELRIALISSDLEVNRDMRNMLSRECGDVAASNLKIKVFEKIPTMEEAVVHFAPQLIIVFVEPDKYEEKMVFLEHLGRVSERIPIVVSSSNLDADFMLACIKKGVRDFLRLPLDSAEIKAMVKRLSHEKPKTGEERQLGETHTFFSYKGGIGTTFLSCNTAVALHELTGQKVLIWDMVFQNGDVSFFFDYDPVASLTDLLENLPRIDAQYLAGVLPPHSSGISILPGAKRPEEAEKIRTDQVHQLHQVLRKHYDYIIVDGGHVLSDPVITVMDNSKHILLTTDLHLPVLKNTLRCLEVFERLGYVEGKFKILLNRYNSKYEKFDLQKAEEILRYPIAYNFSNDYVTASRSLNAGIPVAELDPSSMLAKEFKGLAERFLHDFQSVEKRPSLLDKLFKGRQERPKKPAKAGKEASGAVKENGGEFDAA
jgi:pilus assembly protein CpaE